MPSRMKVLLARIPRLQIHRPLDAFPLFPKLPIEIRLKTWKLACHEQRIIYLTSDAWDFDDQGSHNVPGQQRCPAVVHICKEAREEAMRYYQTFFERTPWDRCHDDEDTGAKYPGNKVFVNFEVDLFVQSPSAFGYFKKTDYSLPVAALGQIRYLQIHALHTELENVLGAHAGLFAIATKMECFEAISVYPIKKRQVISQQDHFRAQLDWRLSFEMFLEEMTTTDYFPNDFKRWMKRGIAKISMNIQIHEWIMFSSGTFVIPRPGLVYEEESTKRKVSLASAP